MPRRGRRTSRLGLVYAVLLIGTIVGASVWLDRHGRAVTARVQEKHERITILHEPSGGWDRHYEVAASFPMSDGTRMSAVVEVPDLRYDALRLGDPIEIRYLPALPVLARTIDRSTAGIAWNILQRLAGIPILEWVLGGLAAIWVASRIGTIPILAAGALWIASAFPLLFSASTPAAPAGVEASARVRAVSVVSKSPSRRTSRRARAFRGGSNALRRLAVPYQVVELAVPAHGGRDTVLAVDAVDSGSVAGLVVGATLPVRLDPAAPREARLVAGTRRFVGRNRYHFLPAVLGIGILAPLGAIGLRRRRRKAGSNQVEETMNRMGSASAWTASLLLLAGASSAEGQYPSPYRPSRPATSAVSQLQLGDTATTAPRAGAMRELVCRGVAGVRIPTQQDPSPRNPNQVAVSLSYQRDSKPAGADYGRLEPGVCSWNPLGYADVPREPGIVYFDLDRKGSAQVPDPVTLARYLGDPQHYWIFYVDDATNISISHGAYRGTFVAESGVRDKPTKSRAVSLRREQLLCRGGAGLAFSRGASTGANLVSMTLAYKVAWSAAGPTGRGLEPGTCAWKDRTEAREEPGRVDFITAGNAQLKQAQSGSEVDRSATAAERWPDMHTIPPYLRNPAHYWSFTVSLANPDSALQHAAWKPSLRDMALAPPPAGSGTSVSLPGRSTKGKRYTPGAAAALTDPRRVFDIRNVQVTSGLEGVVIRFEAAPNILPTVTIHTAAPTGAPGSYGFDAQPLRLAVQGTPTDGTLWRYSAASNAPLARGTQYWFIADAPEGPNSRLNQATGQFRTLAQRMRIGVSEIYVVSDGDQESPGDLWFSVRSCPDVVSGDLAGSSRKNRVEWSEGRHQVGTELASSGVSAPDRFRLFIVGVDDDENLVSGFGSSDPFNAWFFCRSGGGSLEPRATAKAEWNAAVIDIDLTQYPGTTATQTFIRRSQPLREGSKVAFEVRGYITVTRE